MARKPKALEQSGAQSVASKAMHDEYDRMDAGQEPTPLTGLADALVQMQKQMLEAQAASELRTLRLIEEQQAAFRESMARMEERFIEMRAEERERFDATMGEAYERERSMSPADRAAAQHKAMEDVRQRQMQLRTTMDNEARIVGEKLAQEETLLWPFKKRTPIRISGWYRVYEPGIQAIPLSVAAILAEAERDSMRLERMKGVIDATKPEGIPNLAGNPLAIYQLNEQVNQLVQSTL